MYQLATWNVNSLSVRLPQVLDWLQANPVDALCLQELKLSDDKFPHEAIEAAGYQAQVFGQKTYNGVAILVRQTPDQAVTVSDVVKNIPGFADEQARVIALTLNTRGGPLRLVNGYFVNGQAPDTDKFSYKMRWLQALQDWLATELVQHPRLCLVGDFNITADDRDSWDPEGLRETIHHTSAERQALQGLLNLGLHDAFRLFEDGPKHYSWWDYREMAFRRNRGLRIDYTLVSEALKPEVSACQIDKAPRKNERPSDHAPVVLSLTPAPTPGSCG
jgi:exodeoxyribonuclease-3